jgi:hypothetical protein
MAGIYHLEENVFSNFTATSRLSRYIQKQIFFQIGAVFYKDSDRSSSVLANHLARGIDIYHHLNTQKTYGSFEEKSDFLIKIINKQISDSKIKSISIFLSGGADSALLAKLLVLNGVEVHAYHATYSDQNNSETIRKVSNLNNICNRIGISNLTVVYGGLGPEDFAKIYKLNPNYSPAASAVANIFLNTDISSRHNLCFAQGADTLSNTVHTQKNYFNRRESASVKQIKTILCSMYTSTFPKIYRFVGLRIAHKILREIPYQIQSLEKIEIQNLSRLIGMHLVHTPQDSKFFYDQAAQNHMEIFNPFHTLEVEEIYMQSVRDDGVKYLPAKFEIMLALDNLGISDLPFDKSGFKVKHFDKHGQEMSARTYNKNIYLSLQGIS